MALVLALGACSTAVPKAPVVIPVAPREVPSVLQRCPPGPVPPSPPALPRTVESLAEGYNRVKEAQEKAEAARGECAARLDKLNRLVASWGVARAKRRR